MHIYFTWALRFSLQALLVFASCHVNQLYYHTNPSPQTLAKAIQYFILNVLSSSALTHVILSACVLM